MTEGKHPVDSEVEMREIVLPNDTNNHGTIFGGRVLQLMDTACAMAAIRHSRMPSVTVALDDMEFLAPIPQGHFVILQARVNYVARSSMEVGVRVLSECPRTGNIRHTSSAYLTFVALDENGRPAPAPSLEPQTEDEKRRFEEGAERMARRRARRHQG